MSPDPAQRKHYEARCNFLREQEEERIAAEEIGMEKFHLDVARNLLKDDLIIEVVVKYTCSTLEHVQ